MTRLEFIMSDEYITAFLECVVLSGKSVKTMRKEIAEHWMQHRDELLGIKRPRKYSSPIIRAFKENRKPPHPTK